MNISINGKKIECQPGEILLEVAERNGIFIPRLCYHKAFPGQGCCRVCMTEVIENGKSKMVTACIYPVNKECEVSTESEKVIRERRMILSLLSKLAPESSEIKGLCKFYGADKTDELPAEDSGRCILCGRCVKACESLGTGAITTAMRGTEKIVTTPYDDASKDCIGCGSCENICPTKAIDMVDDSNTGTRTIWNREFKLQYCVECGALMGTEESVANAAEKAGVEVPTLCEECRRKELNNTLAKAFGF